MLNPTIETHNPMVPALVELRDTPMVSFGTRPVNSESGFRGRSFVDPDQFQSQVRGGDMYNLLGRGTFRAELMDIQLDKLFLQRGREPLPRLSSSSIPPNRVGIVGWFNDGQLPVIRGAQMRPGEFMCLGLGMQSHHRTFGRNDFATLTLDASDLSRAAMGFLTGRDLAP